MLPVKLRRVWEKNWPEVHAWLTGGLPKFIFAHSPADSSASVPAFCYHVVHPALLEMDLEFLSRNGYLTIDADTMLAHLEGRCHAPQGAVLLSFDDGARNLYDIVYPLLQRYEMTAVAFISPGFHENESGKVQNTANSSHKKPLSWEQIQEMHEAGIIDFQSHTYEHRYIPRWPETSDLAGSDTDYIHALRSPGLSLSEDLLLAKQHLEQRLHKTVLHLAFPQFMGTREAINIGRSIGYRAFWWGTLPHHQGNFPGQSPFYVSRVSAEFVRRLPGEKREPIRKILFQRYRSSILRFMSNFQHSDK